MRTATKTCPKCKATIPHEATRCQHCAANVDPFNQAARGVAILATCALTLIVILALFGVILR